MIPNDFTVEPASWSVDMADLRSVRTEVFVVEQNVPEDEEWDEHDAHSKHVIARDPDGRPIGTGRLTAMHTIGRMAIVRDWRGKGVGAAILRVLLEQARASHIPRIELHAQTHALAFYSRAGFVAFGDEYDECGIAHRSMALDLEPPETRTFAPLAAAPEAVTWISSHRDEARAAILAVIAGARRDLVVFTRELDPELLEHADTLDALKRIALGGPNARIRILVQEPTRAVTLAPRLVALAQRLSSVFALRTPIEEIDRQFAGAFVANDRGGYFERTLATRFDGEGISYAPPRQSQLLSTFNAIWERSEPTVEARRLEI